MQALSRSLSTAMALASGIAICASGQAGVSFTIGTGTYHPTNDAYSYRYSRGTYGTFWGGWHGRQPYSPYYRTPYWSTYRTYPASLYVDTESLIQLAEQVDPQLLSDQEELESSEVPTAEPMIERPIEQRAAAALSSNDYELASTLYQRIADSAVRKPAASASALRDAAVALIGTGDLEQAAAVMRSAFDLDDSLMRRPMSAAIVGSRVEMSRLAIVALRHAEAEPSADAWFLAGVLLAASDEPLQARSAFLEAKQSS